MRYVQATNTGKGFITHADWTNMTFKGRPNSIWEVDGSVPNVNAWISRVGGTEKTSTEADDLEFAVTKYIYTSREFLVGVLTSAEVKFLFDNYGSSVAIRQFWIHILDEGYINVGSARFLTFVEALRDAGYLSQARLDEIIAGRSA